MPIDPVVSLLVTAIGSAIGLIGIVLCRFALRPGHVCWGRRLFMVVVLLLGVGSVAAAWQRNAALPYLGLAFGGLVIGMVWEGPQRRGNLTWEPKTN